jgi:hypothetical protein
MTSRERWTVYPLLFLALGMQFRNKVVGIETKVVQCESLTITDQNGRPVAGLHSAPPNAGRLEFYDADGKVMLVAGTSFDAKAGFLQIQSTSSKNRLPALTLAANDSGGYLQSNNSDGSVVLNLGYEANEPVLYALNPQTNVRKVWSWKLIAIPKQKPAPAKEKPSNAESEKPSTEVHSENKEEKNE